jgi:cell division protein ZapA
MTVEQPGALPAGAMSQVTVAINGRKFRLACEDGQEGHLAQLAGELDRRIGELRTRFGEIGDSRLMLMAALLIADEFAENSTRLRQLEEELASLQEARIASAEHAKATQAAISAALNSAAERIEGLTKRLNAALPEANAALR